MRTLAAWDFQLGASEIRQWWIGCRLRTTKGCRWPSTQDHASGQWACAATCCIAVRNPFFVGGAQSVQYCLRKAGLVVLVAVLQRSPKAAKLWGYNWGYQRLKLRKLSFKSSYIWDCCNAPPLRQMPLNLNLFRVEFGFSPYRCSLRRVTSARSCNACAQSDLVMVAAARRFPTWQPCRLLSLLTHIARGHWEVNYCASAAPGQHRLTPRKPTKASSWQQVGGSRESCMSLNLRC